MSPVSIRLLQPLDVGRGVVYVAPLKFKGGKAEDGVIVSWNSEYVFVRYSGSETPKATRPEDLVWNDGASVSG